MSNFSIDANVKEAQHRSNEELKTELVNLENEFPGVAEVVINDIDRWEVVPCLMISLELKGTLTFPKVPMLVVGGQHCGQPAGRQLLLKLTATWQRAANTSTMR